LLAVGDVVEAQLRGLQQVDEALWAQEQ